MKAVFLPGDKRVEIRAVEVPTPGPGEVLVQVKASCICRSDLSLYYGNAVVGGDAAGKCITGHEPAGIIVSTGAGVKQFKAGDRVAVYLAVGCGVCAACRMGNFFLCPDWRCLGFTADGGNAEYLVVPERNCLRDSRLHLLRRRGDIDGRLRHAVQRLQEASASTARARSASGASARWARAACSPPKRMGARVVAFDPIAERREFAQTLGADLTLDPTAPDAKEKLAAFAGPLGLDAGIDCSGTAGRRRTWRSTACGRLGSVAFIGESRETTIRPSDQLIRKQLTLIGSWYFNIAEYEEIVDVLIGKKIDLERLATHRFSIDEAETAFRLFDERKTEKAVFVF